MLHVTICDDDKIIADKIKDIVEFEMKKREQDFEFHIYERGNDFLKADILGEELIFMDIEMPGISGIEVAEQLREDRRNENLIFLTSYEHLVFTSLKCFPFHFMQKDKMEEEMGTVLEEFFTRKRQRRNELEYSIKNEIYHVPINEIMYLTYWEHKITLVLEGGEKQQFRGKIKECEKQLGKEEFFKANQGAIVNLKYCRILNEIGFLMKDKEIIQVSREKKKEAKQVFMGYRRKHYE